MTTKRRARPAPEAALTAFMRPIPGQPWAIDPGVLRQMWEFSRRTSALDIVDLRAAFGVGGAPSNPNANSPIRVLPIYGPITNHASFWSTYFGGASVDQLRTDLLTAINDPTVKAILFAISSPGGEVQGMTEFAAELRAQRGGSKPIVAMIDPFAQSAAYWIASQCDEIVLTPSGSAGSIGVYTIYEEISGALDKAGVTETVIGSSPEKTEALGLAPLSDGAEAYWRDMILAHAGMFTNDVSKGRNVSVDAVNSTFGQGRVLMAKQALQVGMVDRIDTMANTMTRLARTTRPAGAKAEGDGPEVVAEGETPAALEAEETPERVPFTDRITRFAAEATDIASHAEERARLRTKEQRTPISSKNLTALRASHAAIGKLLSVGEGNPDDLAPDAAVEPQEPVAPAPAPAVEPPVATAPTPAPAVREPRFHSREEWLEHLQEVG